MADARPDPERRARGNAAGEAPVIAGAEAVSGGRGTLHVRPLPPGPKGRLLTGSLLDYGRDQLNFLERCAHRYGDVVCLRLLNTRTYLLNHPDHVEYVLVKNNHNFIKSRGERSNLGFLGEGLLTSEGSFWRRQRRLIQPAFHRDRIRDYGAVMVRCAERMISSWQDGEVREVHADATRLTAEIATQTLFGALPPGELEEVVAVASEINRRLAGRRDAVFFVPERMVPERIPTPGNLRFRRAVRSLDRIVHGMIRRRRDSGEDVGDLLSMLLAVQDEDTGETMSDKQLHDEVLTMLLAAAENVANTLPWSWYLVSRNPKAEARLHEELEEALAGRAPTVEDLPRLRYADAVIQETLRLYPPAWAFGREALENCEIGGYRVPAGTQLILSPWVTHRDPRFFEEPEEFRPERWLDGSTQGLPRYAYFPFGGGPRACIGRSFAMVESVLLLAAVSRRFRLVPVSERPAVPLVSVTLRPKGGMRMALARR